MTAANTAKYWKREANLKECTILGLRAEIERLETGIRHALSVPHGVEENLILLDLLK